MVSILGHEPEYINAFYFYGIHQSYLYVLETIVSITEKQLALINQNVSESSRTTPVSVGFGMVSVLGHKLEYINAFYLYGIHKSYLYMLETIVSITEKQSALINLNVPESSRTTPISVRSG